MVGAMISDWGWTADKIISDYGEDLDCHVFLENQRTPLHFRCQVKSSKDAEKKVRRLKSGDFSVSISSETCREWLLAYYPVLLIVYDREAKTAYWTDAFTQLRGMIKRLSRKSTTLHVAQDHVLERDQRQILLALTSFYSRLYKVQSESVERMVFPVLMPGYRVPPFTESRALLRVGYLKEDRPEGVSIFRNTLPAWTTVLRTLDSQFLAGMLFRIPSADLNEFSALLHDELMNVEAPSGEGEWLAFVCSPIQFSVQHDEQAKGSLGRELTGWSSYAKVGESVFPDHEYAFQPPAGFIREIGRRARSWPGYFCICPTRDVSVQLLAGVATTPADRLQQSTLREHMLGQFLAWECPVGELDTISNVLWEAELIFAPLPAEIRSVSEDIVAGTICTPWFSPAVGLIPTARDWRELERGTVRSRLELGSLLAKLPGHEAGSELKSAVIGLLDHLAREAPDEWLVEGAQAEDGIPLNLSARRVVLQRFRLLPHFDVESTTQILETFREDLQKLLSCDDSLEISAGTMEWFNGEIAVLTISWSPLLEMSSAKAVEIALVEVTKAFDAVLPQAPGKDEDLSTSMGVLRFAGEIYFEGDRLY